MQQKFIISKKFAKNNFLKIKKGTPILYLSHDYSSLVKLREMYKDVGDICTLELKFHDKLNEIKNDFLSLSNLINSRNSNDYYWSSQLASRNSAGIPLLRNLIFALSGVDFLKKHVEGAVVIVDNIEVGNIIYSGSSDNIIEAKYLFREKFSRALIWIRLLKRFIEGFLRSVLIWFYCRFIPLRRYKQQIAQSVYLIQSWYCKGSLNERGDYTDRNFDPLIKSLEKKGEEIWLFPLFYNLDSTICHELRKISKSQFNFLIPERCISLVDLLLHYFNELKKLFIDASNLTFCRLSVANLVKSDHLNSCLAPDEVRYNLIYPVLKRISKYQNLKLIIYPFENNCIEKMTIIAAKKFFPKTPTYGIQHSVWYREQLGMELLEEELSSHPLPDYIVATGSRYQEVLKKLGFPDKRILLGPSFRFPDVGPNGIQRVESIYDIVVILNFDIDQAFEVLEKLNRSLRHLDFGRIGIKLHPLLDVQRIRKFLVDINFDNFEFADLSVSELIKKTKSVVMSCGSVSNLEVMSAGVPLIRISLGSNYNFDPLWSDYPLNSMCYSLEDLLESLLIGKDISKLKQEKLNDFGNKMVEEYFYPVNNDTVNDFIVGLDSPRGKQ